MNKQEIKNLVGNEEYKSEIKVLKNHMSNMHTAIRGWDIKCKLINLDPEPPTQDNSKLIKDAIAKYAKEKSKKLNEISDDEKSKITTKIEKENKPEKHSGYWIIQGNHKSPNGNTFNFQVVREHGIYQSNGNKPQYKVILEFNKEQSIETYPQTNPDIKAILTNYMYNPKSTKLNLIEEKAASK